MPAGPVSSTEIFAGTVMVGANVSRTVTVNDPEATFVAPSVAEHVTVVVPSGNVAPDAGAQVVVTAPLTASRAVAV